MVQKAEEWIASLIEGQLSAAINWRLVRDLRQRRHPYIKQEPGINAGSGSTDGPYEDNGTDLKIRLLPNHLRSFQLLKILNLNSSDAALNCVVTDGFTEIRATLSDEAVATIEDELERRISLEDHGDIVTCKSASIHATPYGIPSCQVQLYVASLEYEYHLRKPIGKGTPIEARQIVINAVREITQLQDLKSGYVELDAGNGDEHAGGDVPPVAPSQTLVPRSSDRPTRRLDGPDSATHSQAIPATPHSPSGIRQPHSKRSRQTRFDREGLEVIQGVNFHKPVSIGRATTERESSPDDMPPRVVSRTTFTQLSNLLSKTKPSTSEEVPQKSQAESSRAIGSVVEGNNIPAQAEREPTPRNCGSTAPTRLTPAAPTPEAVNVALDADQPRGPHKHSPRTLFNYHRRKIPHDQQRLLESQLSWFPPLPGKQFPHPNVPIALLQKWKESASERSRGSKQNSTHTEQPSHPGIATSVEEEESSSESESDKKSASEDEADTDSDEMLSEEEWPPTPQVAQQLPPDSSLPGQIPNATPSQRPPAATGELELEVPRTIADPAVAHRKARSDHFRAMQRRKW
ncbi:hypothetical protein K431DRAFT_284458 [Polychaeton citri CBS 116435]|uniref:Shelterin complex subunit TPP1/Est3 domain-containing protein n=1 Tax=Polychaeton citri CBS 116435 TaxID=1314669 RepID=A0A9P4UMY2_9PEZI|nr:hypothetical protein K431DRAFT_284458 [Polychaeton citri CBS 116435]